MFGRSAGFKRPMVEVESLAFKSRRSCTDLENQHEKVHRGVASGESVGAYHC